MFYYFIFQLIKLVDKQPTPIVNGIDQTNENHADEGDDWQVCNLTFRLFDYPMN